MLVVAGVFIVAAVLSMTTRRIVAARMPDVAAMLVCAMMVMRVDDAVHLLPIPDISPGRRGIVLPCGSHKRPADHMRTILVPLDGSFKDVRAIPVAAAFADLAHTDLRLVRVFDTPVEHLSPRAGRLGVKDAAVELKAKLEQSVRETADGITAETGRSVTAEVAEGVDVAGVLVTRAAEAGVILVVMGTQAASVVGRALRGSVADRVMRESPRPVVLVPPRTDDVNRKDNRFRRVLIPLDGSAFGLAAVNQVMRLPGGSALAYVLLEVVTPAFLQGSPPALEALAETGILDARSRLPETTREHRAAEKRLNTVAEKLRAQGVAEVKVRVIEGADPPAEISRAIRAEQADFVAMTTRGSSGLKRFVLGSVAEKVVRESVVPVLLVTPR